MNLAGRLRRSKPRALLQRRDPWLLFGSRRVAAVLGLLAAAAFGGPGSAQAQETSLRGTFSVPYMGAELTLVLDVSASGDVRGRLFGPQISFDAAGRQSRDDEGDLGIEGNLMGPTGPGGTFEFFEDEDGEFGFLLIPNSPSGEPLTSQAELLYATRTSREPDMEALSGAGGEAVGGQSGANRGGAESDMGPGVPGGPGIPADHPLIGIWSTQVVMNDPAGSIATEIAMQIFPNGVMVELGSRAIGGGIDTGWEGGGDRAFYRVQGDVMNVSLDGTNWAPFVRFRFRRGGDLEMNYLQDNSQQVWSRRN